jgi:hypothetical protein
VKQKWWLIAAGVVGIGLAILLFPKPDTGSSIPDPTPGRVSFDAAPEVMDGDQSAGQNKTDAPTATRIDKRTARLTGPIANIDPAAVQQLRRGPSPTAMENVRRRAEPEAVFAGRVAGSISLIRRQLLLSDSDAAKDLGNEMASLVSSLREQRRDPRLHDFAILLEDATEFGNKVRSSPDYMADEQIVQSIERLDQSVAEYAEVKNQPQQ